MLNSQTKKYLVSFILFTSIFSLLTACGKKEVEEKQNPTAVKVIDGDDVEFKEPESK
ncbi:hypothetical protein AB3H85_00920 [Enterococcus sp. C78]|jgi:endonuclease YncB( thermonuclease family)|uniref:hypothetical protein n=1 Tax=Enterococcus sp. C78 TaxID=3231336 RepID=UPI0034A076ED